MANLRALERPGPHNYGMTSPSDIDHTGIRGTDREDAEQGLFEITIQVRGAARVNRLLSWIVRSQAYDDVECLSVAFQGDRDEGASDKTECA
jgi:hypothetical protein